MSHRGWIGFFLVLASGAFNTAAGAQPPATGDPTGTQSTQPQAQTKEAPATEAASANSSTTGQPQAANNSAALPTIQVNGGPSADILRSARNAGFKIKIADGKWHFCKTEAPIGTRFVSESCMNEQQVTLWLGRAQDQREKLAHMLGAPAASR
jgi:hypothetical protein